MKRNIITLVAIGAIALAGYAFAQPDGGRGGHGRWHHGFAMEHLTKSLNLTADQQAKVQPLIDQARPQIIAIHKTRCKKRTPITIKPCPKTRPSRRRNHQKKSTNPKKPDRTSRTEMRKSNARNNQN